MPKQVAPFIDLGPVESHAVNQETACAPAQPVDPSSLLSAREREVLDYITKGFKTNEVAKLMQLSHFTVRSFVRRIYGKLKVTSKAEAIYEAKALGLARD